MEQVHLDKTYILAANKAAKEFTYGQIIKKQWLIENFMLNEPKYGTRYDYEKFAFEFLENIEGMKKNMLEAHKMCMRSVRGEGYLIVMPNDQSDYAMDNFKNNVGQAIKKVTEILKNVDESLLTDESIRRRDEQIGKVAALAAFTKKRIKN